MKVMPTAVPAFRIREKNFRKIVAAATVIIDVNSRKDVPTGNSSLFSTPPMMTRHDEVVIAVPKVYSVISSPPKPLSSDTLSGSTGISTAVLSTVAVILSSSLALPPGLAI